MSCDAVKANSDLDRPRKKKNISQTNLFAVKILLSSYHSEVLFGKNFASGHIQGDIQQYKN